MNTGNLKRDLDQIKIQNYLVDVLIEGLGPHNVLWATDAVLLGRPQWVIEAFLRLKIFDIFEDYFGVSPTARHGNLSEAQVKHRSWAQTLRGCSTLIRMTLLHEPLMTTYRA